MSKIVTKTKPAPRKVRNPLFADLEAGYEKARADLTAAVTKFAKDGAWPDSTKV